MFSVKKYDKIIENSTNITDYMWFQEALNWVENWFDNNNEQADQYLEDAKNLLRQIEKATKENPSEELKELFNKFQKEYQQVENKYNQYRGNITSETLNSIEQEYDDLVQIHEEAFENSENPSWSLKDIALSGLSSVIDFANEYITSEEEVLEDLKYYGNQITIPAIQDDIKREINALEGWKKIDDWTLLLFSYSKSKEYAMTNTIADQDWDTWSDISRSIHNTAQDWMIQDILGNRYYSDSKLRAYDAEVGNYLLSIDTFKNQITNQDIQTINRMGLISYLKNLEFDGNLTFDYLKGEFGFQKASQLIDFTNRNKEFKDKVNSEQDSSIWKTLEIVFKSVSNYLSRKIDIIFTDINNLDEEALYEIKELVGTDKERFNEFRNKLIDKFWGNEKIVDTLLDELKWNKNLQQILPILNKYKDYLVAQEGNNIKKLAEDVYDYQVSDVGRRIVVINENENLSNEEKANRLRLLQLEKQRLNKDQVILNYLSNDQVESISTVEDFNTTIEELRQQDSSFDAELKYIEQDIQYTEDEIQIYTPNLVIKNPQINSIVPIWNNNTYEIQTNSWIVTGITTEEFNIINNPDNPEALNNLINFRNIMNEVNLDEVFNLRWDIFTCISEIGIDINSSDYLNKDEIKRFLHIIIKSLQDEFQESEQWITIGIENMDLENTTQVIKQLNKQNSIWGQEEVNISGDSYLEDKFINAFAPRDSGIGFKKEIFSKKIN